MITDEQIKAKIEQIKSKGGTVCMLPPYIAGDMRRDTLNIGQIFLNKETVADTDYQDFYIEYRSVKVADVDIDFWNWMYDMYTEYQSSIVNQFDKYLGT